ncbi:hypothetical protein BGX27_010391 [Mortierella sp. AM989]|nr:hypothetical protein BGX27_010391 [Mortierella sp. AM989]
MKISTSALLVSAALATIASAIPLDVHAKAKVDARLLTKRCVDCTNTDGAALDIIIQASAVHYSSIAQQRLNGLMTTIETSAKVTSGTQDMQQEKNLLNVAVQANVEQAKEACTPEALAPVIKATVASDASLDVAWSKKEEIEKKMVELDAMITKLMLERIQANINAEILSKDCTEKMTNTRIAPAPAVAPAPVPVQAPQLEAAPACTDCDGPKAGIDVAASVDSKFVCKSGCKDSDDANTVLSLRINLENEFKPHVDDFDKEVPKDCEEKRGSLLGNVLSLVAKLNVNA